MLDESATFRSRGELKSQLLQTLYLLRVHVLHIKPTPSDRSAVRR
jgi:hypothetical protein